jgi:myosin protein heavy chain
LDVCESAKTSYKYVPTTNAMQMLHSLLPCKDCNVEELKNNKEELSASGKDWEKRLKSLEIQLLTAQEERDLAERQRKQLSSERDELQLELDSALNGKNAFSEEKRRFEEKISQLEDDLEDEQSNNEQTLDKLKKLQFDLDKMSTDLHIEKSNFSKAENAKLLLEKQNRELRDKVTELEELAKGRNKTVISNLEAKMAQLEEQLHLESNEKNRLSREFKKAEKRMREMQCQIEEERKNVENYKEQVKLN